MTNPTDARARLDAYMRRESDADQAEFTALVDTVVAEAVKKERWERLADHQPVLDALAEARARIAELSQQRDDLLAEAVKMLDVPDDTLRAAQDDLKFLHENTLPDLRRTIQHHEDGKQRWRERAEKADARIAAVLALHTKHSDSEHCEHDGEPWPCPTVKALQP